MVYTTFQALKKENYPETGSSFYQLTGSGLYSLTGKYDNSAERMAPASNNVLICGPNQNRSFMKKRALYPVTLFFLLLCSTAYSQKLSLNDNVINVGIGFGSTYSFNSHYGGFPALSVSYERIWPKEIGPGLLGVGAIVGYRSMSYKYNVGDNRYKDKFNTLLIAARGTYYWEKLVTEKYNVYGAALVGVRTENYKADGAPGVLVDDNTVHPFVGVVAGGRYYFTPNISVFAELGYDISWTKAGISARF